MNTSLYPQRGRGTVRIVGWLALVALGTGLTWYGFVWAEDGGPGTCTGSSLVAMAHPVEESASPVDTSWPSSAVSDTAPEPMPVPVGASSAAPVESADSQLAGVETWPAEVFRLINQVRAENGLLPYTYDETLERAAQLHGQDCQERGECDHTGSDGSNVETRIRRAGYDPAGQAEVLVYSSSPQAAVAWWMDEMPPNDPHRSTLLSTWVTEIGVAVVPTGRGDYYFIADFGRPAVP